MSHLVPEKRMDRNGKLVTKHVRSTPQKRSTGSIPPPGATTEAKPPRVPAARTKPVLWDMYKTYTGADNQLKIASLPYAPHSNYYFEASDVEAYAVMSRVSPPNAVPLLACGVRNGDDAEAFLRNNNLAHLIMDGSAMPEGALAANVPAQVALEFWSEMPNDYLDNPHYFEAMSVYSNKTLRKALVSPPLHERVFSGDISSSDISFLGARRITATKQSSVVVRQLERIHQGTAKLTIEDLSDLIDKAITDGNRNSVYVSEIVRLAEEYGTDFALNLKNALLAAQFSASLHQAGYDRSRMSEVLLWHDELRAELGASYIPHDNITTLFEAGIDAREAGAGMQANMTVQQIIGVHVNNIPRSVSGGWL